MIKKTTLLTLKCLVLVAFTQVLNAQQIYTNGPLSTGATSYSAVTAPSGYTWSECQNDTGNTTESNANAGFSGVYTSSLTINNQLADDFTVPVGAVWNIGSFEFFAYQTGSTATSVPFDQLRIQLFNGDPAAGGTVIAGDMTTNVLDVTNSVEAMTYRIFNSTTPAPAVNVGTTRKIWKLVGNLPISLSAGTYWVVYQIHATNDMSAFLPPVTLTGTRTIAGWNAKQNISGATGWADLIDSGTPATAPDVNQDMAFNINGNQLPSNDNCSNALIATTIPYTNTQVFGATTTNNGGFIVAECDGATGGMNDGIWYSFTGDGFDVAVSVTGVEATFDPQLSVYTGSCGALTCVGSSDTGINGEQESVLIIQTIIGGVYWVNVGGNSQTIDNPEGNFTMSMSRMLANDAFSNETFKAYPNPVKDILNLSYIQEISNVELYNIVGQQVIVKTVNANQSQIDMSQLVSGTYLVKVFADNQIQTIKVVKE